jgi:hypothetical protein
MIAVLVADRYARKLGKTWSPGGVGWWMQLRGWGWRYAHSLAPSKGYEELSVNHVVRTEVFQN